jgi:hypothetical protein
MMSTCVRNGEQSLWLGYKCSKKHDYIHGTYIYLATCNYVVKGENEKWKNESGDWVM